MHARDRIIADLRLSIEGIEKRPRLVGRRGARDMAARSVPQVGAGSLNEVIADTTRDAGAALGFCLFEAQGLVTAVRQAVIFLQMRAAAQEIGLPYGPGLSAFGFDPAALALVRVDTVTEMLWAMEEAAGCRNVAAVIGDFARDHKRLDFTASRRLSLRAEAFGVTPFVLHYGGDRVASAAPFRWHVAALPSAEAAFDARAPGAPRYRVTLEKGGGWFGSGGAAERNALGQDFWLLKWTENGLVADGTFPGEGITGSPVRERNNQKDITERRDGAGKSGGAALSGTCAAGLGDRLPQTA